MKRNSELLLVPKGRRKHIMLGTYAHRVAVLLAAFALGAGFLTASGNTAAAIPYPGVPDLKLTVDLVTAGTGPKGFDSHVLFSNMYGSAMPAEAGHLQERYGGAAVNDFFTLMDFTIADVLNMVKRDRVALPTADAPLSPVRLDRSVYLIGHAPTGKYDVGYMIERLISHKYHHELMMDLNSHFPQNRVATFHSVLGSVVEDTTKVSP